MIQKTKIILCSVVAICGLGLVGSQFIDWSVDNNDADGDIAKSALLSNKQTAEKLTNMEELLQNDSAFKEGIVAAQVVMQTRAIQFGTLVDMSNEVAGGIPTFGGVIKEMNATRVMVENVNKSLAEAGGDLNAALGGKECPNLAQNTINASQAYTILQRQNKLANNFIEATDKYLKTTQGDDRLKFVRDQWLEYQQVTAALEGDKESADKLAKKGNLLSGEKSLATMANFGLANQVAVLTGCHVAKSMYVNTELASAIKPEQLAQVVSTIRSAAKITMQHMGTGGEALQNKKIEKIFTKAVNEAVRKASNEAVASQINMGLANANKVGLKNADKHDLGMGPIIMSTVKMANAANVMSAFNVTVSNIASSPDLQQSQKINFSDAIGDIIAVTSLGNVGKLNL